MGNLQTSHGEVFLWKNMKNELVRKYLMEQAICGTRGTVKNYGLHAALLGEIYGQLLDLESARLHEIRERRHGIPLAPHLRERFRNYKPMGEHRREGLKLRRIEEIANGEFFTGVPFIWQFGPTYNVQTTHEENLTILTMNRDYDAAYDNPDLEEQLQSYRQTYMLALDEKGYHVAFQELNFTYRLDEYYRRKEEYYLRSGSKPNPTEPKERKVEVYTDIYTALRGKGLAIPLQMAALDFFQREANRLGYPITRTMQNASEFLHDPDEEEARRWHKIWGHNGWFSHDPRYGPNVSYREAQSHKNDSNAIVAWMQFIPAKEAIPIDQIANITITRTLTSATEGDLIHIQRVLTKENNFIYQENQRAYLQQLVTKWDQDGIMTLVLKDYDY